MAQRRHVIVGNWKMNGSSVSARRLADDLAQRANAQKPLPFDVVICPPFPLIVPVLESLTGSPLHVGGQDAHTDLQGSYTGDVSPVLLADLGCRYVILGHSERRTAHQETSATVAAKMAAAQKAGLQTIVCVGESQDQRDQGEDEAIAVVVDQLLASLPPNVAATHLLVAYEPLWAIGTGRQPKVRDIRTIHRAIRKALGPCGETTPVLYGGSVTAANALALLHEPEVDGVLVGGASLDADSFWAIAEAAR